MAVEKLEKKILRINLTFSPLGITLVLIPFTKLEVIIHIRIHRNILIHEEIHD